MSSSIAASMYKPCPTCGAQPVLVEWNEKRLPPFTLSCPRHRLAGGKTEEEVTKNWNREEDQYGNRKEDPS